MAIVKEGSYISNLLQRYGKMCAAIVVGAIVLAAIATVIMPKRYESEVKFLVNNERADLVITPDKEQAAAPPNEVTENQVNSEMELLKSRDILDAVVRDRGLAGRKSDTGSISDQKAIQRARIKLEKSLMISAVRKSNIIDVTYDDSNADRAAAVLQDLKSRYLATHLEVHGAAGTNQFFSEQLDRFEKRLTDARNALTAFHLQTHLFVMPQQEASVIDHYQTADFNLKDINAQIEEQQTRLHEGKVLLSHTPDRVETQVKEVSDQYALQQLEPVLNQLENKRIELLTKFKPTDRLVTEVNEQISGTRADLQRIRMERVGETTTDVNPLHESIMLDNAKGDVGLKGLITRRDALTKEKAGYLQELGDMDKSYVELEALEQQEKEAQDDVLLYTHRLEEARVAEALDRAKFSNVAVIEEPVVSPIPVSPKLSLNLALGAAMGLFLSLGIILMRETREHSFGLPTTVSEPHHVS